ncbi:hypothetical protein NKH18_50960 [Streptomyces sp. M10(2022)]
MASPTASTPTVPSSSTLPSPTPAPTAGAAHPHRAERQDPRRDALRSRGSLTGVVQDWVTDGFAR